MYHQGATVRSPRRRLRGFCPPASGTQSQALPRGTPGLCLSLCPHGCKKAPLQPSHRPLPALEASRRDTGSRGTPAPPAPLVANAVTQPPPPPGDCRCNRGGLRRHGRKGRHDTCWFLINHLNLNPHHPAGQSPDTDPQSTSATGPCHPRGARAGSGVQISVAATAYGPSRGPAP